MGDEAEERVPESELTAGSNLPARVRSAFLTRGRSRTPEPRVRFGWSLLPGLACLGAAQRSAAGPILAAAEELRADRITLLGRTMSCDRGVDWAAREATPAWRVALHGLEHLMAAGFAAALAESPEERAAWWTLVRTHLLDWLHEGIRGHGAAARLEAQTRRTTNLIRLVTIFGDELVADPDTRRALLDAVHTDATSLAVTVPRHPADAWLVVGANALFTAGRFFDGEEARGWVESATSILWRQLHELVHDDGGLRDRNPARHALVLSEYLEVLASLWTAMEETPAWERKRVKAMAYCLARLLHPSGELALNDGGSLAPPHPGREMLAVAAVVLEEPALATPGELPGIWPVAILGERGRRVYQGLARLPQAPAPRALRRTGFYVLPGAEGDVLILDASASGAGGRIGGFAFELSVGGQLLIVGPGAGADDGHPMAQYARSPRARNVVLDRQALAALPGRSTSEAQVYWTMRDGLLCFSGLDRRSAELRHRRCVFCLPGRFWIVCDELVGTGHWEGESLLHLHPEARLLAACAGRPAFVAERSDKASVAIVLASGGEGEVRVHTGLDGARPQGWYAARPGEFVPAPALSVTVAGTLPLVTGYALLPRCERPATLTVERDAFQLTAVLRQGNEEFAITAMEHDVELVRRTPSLESAAPDQLRDARLVVAE